MKNISNKENEQNQNRSQLSYDLPKKLTIRLISQVIRRF